MPVLVLSALEAPALMPRLVGLLEFGPLPALPVKLKLPVPLELMLMEPVSAVASRIPVLELEALPVPPPEPNKLIPLLTVLIVIVPP